MSCISGCGSFSRRATAAVSLSARSVAGRISLFVLSPQLPAESEIFEIQSRSFNPELRAGQRLCFSLRANPTICKAGKRHDLLMDAKRQVKEQVEPRDIWAHQQQAALAWLTRQGEQSGFSLAETVVDAYRQQQIRRENRARPFSSAVWITPACWW